MTGGARTEAACLEASMADIPHMRPISIRIADVMDEVLFPEMAQARAHYAAMSAELRAELDKP